MSKIIIRCESGEITQEISDIITESVDATFRHFAMSKKTEVYVLLTDNAHIREMNRMTRGIDRATDVLSFPMLSFSEEGKVEATPADYEGEYLYLGDMVLSLEKAAEQAGEYGHSLRREVGFLTVHSMLHLLGFDHMEEAEGERMRAKEKEILNEMGLVRA